MCEDGNAETKSFLLLLVLVLIHFGTCWRAKEENLECETTYLLKTATARATSSCPCRSLSLLGVLVDLVRLLLLRDGLFIAPSAVPSPKRVCFRGPVMPCLPVRRKRRPDEDVDEDEDEEDEAPSGGVFNSEFDPQ